MEHAEVDAALGVQAAWEHGCYGLAAPEVDVQSTTDGVP